MWKGQRTVDVHGHMTTPADYRAFAAGLTANRTPRNARLQISDDALEGALQRHLKKMDDGNIDYQLLGPRPVSMSHWESLYLQNRYAEVTNDVIAQTVRLHPDRFAGMAQLPQHWQHDTKACLEEFERSVKDLGFVGAYRLGQVEMDVAVADMAEGADADAGQRGFDLGRRLSDKVRRLGDRHGDVVLDR